MLRKITFYTITLLIILNPKTFSQGQTEISRGELSGQVNTVQSAVPFLTIAPDSRAGAMGDAGVATSPDVNSMHWNPAKYAFIENKGGVSVSYTPWLRNLVGDIDLINFIGYYKIDKQQVLAASLVYFSLGDIEFRDDESTYVKTAKPNEFSIDVAYSRQFSPHISGGLAFRYIRSDLASGTVSNGVEATAGQAFAADISMYYNKKVKLSDKDGKMSFGLNISNIGNKMSYTKDLNNKDFLPINMRLGGALGIDMDNYNSLTATVDFNKLLVPTPPVYWTKVNGGDSLDSNNKHIVRYGKDTDVPVVQGMLQSFSDAPGGFKEEIKEINYSIGLEYWYRKQFAIRTGYFHESETKGNRKFYTIGCGLKLNVFGLDFSYLIPTAANNPLAHTLRFTLMLDFDSSNKATGGDNKVTTSNQ